MVPIARKLKTHRMIGPEAPRNLNPKASNSIGPFVTFKTETIQKAVITESGVPTIAAKCLSRMAVGRVSGFALAAE